MINKLFEKRISSFTIIELIITLLISSITIAICYYSYLLFSTQFSKYQLRGSEMNEYNSLETALQMDAARAGRILDTIDNNHFIFFIHDTSVYYSFGDKKVVRQFQENRDTFSVMASATAIAYESDSIHLVNKIGLKARLNKEDLAFSVVKKYSAQEIMNAEQLQNEQSH